MNTGLGPFAAEAMPSTLPGWEEKQQPDGRANPPAGDRPWLGIRVGGRGLRARVLILIGIAAILLALVIALA